MLPYSTIFGCFVICGLLCTCDPAPETQAGADADTHDHAAMTTEAKPKALSPHTTAMGNIGDTHVHIDYSSPGKRGRMLWGGLVAYDRVWSAGAHNATAITFSEPVRVAGRDVPAGTYGFFTIPGREEWTLILNENYEQHLADDYDEALDVLRYRATPEVLDGEVESLTYAVHATGDGAGSIRMSWDSLRVSLPVASTK
jgi:hypothetical protein